MFPKMKPLFCYQETYEFTFSYNKHTISFCQEMGSCRNTSAKKTFVTMAFYDHNRHTTRLARKCTDVGVKALYTYAVLKRHKTRRNPK